MSDTLLVVLTIFAMLANNVIWYLIGRGSRGK